MYLKWIMIFKWLFNISILIEMDELYASWYRQCVNEWNKLYYWNAFKIGKNVAFWSQIKIRLLINHEFNKFVFANFILMSTIFSFFFAIICYRLHFLLHIYAYGKFQTTKWPSMFDIDFILNSINMIRIESMSHDDWVYSTFVVIA